MFAKLEELAVPVYPRMRKVFQDLTKVSAARRTQGWRSLLDELVSPEDPA